MCDSRSFGATQETRTQEQDYQGRIFNKGEYVNKNQRAIKGDWNRID